MNKTDKILLKVLSGRNDANIEFKDLLTLMISLGFEVRIKGSHHILTRISIIEIINIQPDINNKSKVYQVKQIRKLITKYQLGELGDE